MKPIIIKPKITVWAIGFLLAVFFSVFIAKENFKTIIGASLGIGLVILYLKFRVNTVLTEEYIESTNFSKIKIKLNEIKRIDLKLKGYGHRGVIGVSNTPGRTASMITIKGDEKKLGLSALVYSEKQLAFLMKNLLKILKQRQIKNVYISPQLVEAIKNHEFIDYA
ncbi:hypothetical protein ACFL0Y_01990 [Patescibacteria group bacterium]